MLAAGGPYWASDFGCPQSFSESRYPAAIRHLNAEYSDGNHPDRARCHAVRLCVHEMDHGKLHYCAAILISLFYKASSDEVPELAAIETRHAMFSCVTTRIKS